MFRTTRGFICAAALLTAFAATPAVAQVTEFTDRGAFSAAAGPTTLIDFNDQVTPPDTFVTYPGGTTTISGVTFSANNALFAVTSDYFAGYDLGDGTVLSWQAATPNVLTITLPAGTVAVGMDFGSFGPTSFTFDVAGDGSYTHTGGTGGSPPAPFEGFVSTLPITSLTITNSNDAGPQIDRFVFSSSVAAVPEPSTAALGLGALGSFLGLAARLRRRHRA